jgi:hypothetical protein
VIILVVVGLVAWFIYRAFSGGGSGTPNRTYTSDYSDNSVSTSSGNWFSNLFTSSSSDDYYDSTTSSGSTSSDSSSDSSSSDSGGGSSDS